MSARSDAHDRFDDLDRAAESVEEAAEHLRDQIAKLRGRVYPETVLFPPPARTIAVTDADVTTLGRLVDPYWPEWHDIQLRSVLVAYHAHLAERTQAGGPQVNDDDIAESREVLKKASRDNVDVVRALLEHDRARMWVRTGDAA
ncbi:hypothetical protein [Frankia sp. AgW1.1]|uniref:hypothetical protein n=1 Tax=Frankia sp. AgW1.1 TaxID=1836971 RepID=UPI0019331665|nr:hypothetical protein [Frankia sp. AgW1.1]MBL7487035.1 hypothetical protein [Frankia sp. AgW1.1]